jgi:hypothetical protein
LVSYTPSHTDTDLVSEPALYAPKLAQLSSPFDVNSLEKVQARWLVFAAACFLVSVPVFIQAPLVRTAPWLSLALTPLLWIGAKRLLAHPNRAIWGDLLVGFAWIWLAGGVYWGWLRWEPFLHLPVEAIGLPFAIWGLRRGQGVIGHWFYIGSLLGTAITDLYFYLINLIPHWRQLMVVPVDQVRPIFQSAVAQIQTPWGVGSAIALLSLLLVTGIVPLRSPKMQWWAFGGAVLSTILVDGLFWLAATMA